MLYNDKYLERFFSHFPEASGLEQFGTPDILAYKEWLEKEGTRSAFKVMQEIKALDRFFRYLTIDCKLPLTNPAKPFVKNVKLHSIIRRKKDSLRLEEYKRLIDTCLKIEPRLLFWLTRMIQGIGSYDRHMNGRQASWMLRRVAKEAGLPHVTMRHIKTSLRHGLWRSIIKDWQNRFLADLGYKQGTNSHLQHIELPGDPFGDIKLAPLNVGTPISNSSNNPLPVSGIANLQESTEAQSP